MTSFYRKIFGIFFSGSIVCLGLSLRAQDQSQTGGGSSMPGMQGTTQGGKSQPSVSMSQTGSPRLTAAFVEQEANAQKNAATVQVNVSGLRLTDPAAAGGQPKPGQGHIHYQVDNGPVVATPVTKLSFHGLTPGQHQIIVMLAGNDHTPLGPEQRLTLTIPQPQQ
jgi:hypothetical protein